MKASRPCVVESLEPRTLMSAAFVAGGTLIVLGDARVANSISVGYTDSTESMVEVKVTSTTRKGVRMTLDKTFAASAMKYLYVRGGKQADNITVGNRNLLFNKDCRIDAGAGNDTVMTYDAAGSHVLAFGGKGDDNLTVGNGDDKVWGGAGDDVINAGSGKDAFGCILGHNTVNAGAGHNTYYAPSIEANTTTYDPTKDKLVITKRESDAPTASPAGSAVA